MKQCSFSVFRAGNNVLNSKAEFNRAQVPRMSVTINDGSQESSEKNRLYQDLERKVVSESGLALLNLSILRFGGNQQKKE